MKHMLLALMVAAAAPAFAGQYFSLSDANAKRVTGILKNYDHFNAGYDSAGAQMYTAQIECAPDAGGSLEDGDAKCHIRNANGFSRVNKNTLYLTDKALNQSLIIGLLKNGFGYTVQTKDESWDAAGGFVTCTVSTNDEGQEMDPYCSIDDQPGSAAADDGEEAD